MEIVRCFLYFQELNKQRETEVTDMTEKRDKVQVELDNVRSELTSRLKAAEDEVHI